MTTIKQALQSANEKLSSSGLEHTRTDARVLLCFALGKDSIYIITHLDKKIEDKHLNLYNECIEKRAKKMPLAYIVGQKEFMGHDFLVNSHTLIPRPDSELLVEYIAKEFKESEEPVDMLEIGIGSGNLSISLLKDIPKSRILGVDINEETIETANQNIKKLLDEQQRKRIRFMQSNLFEKVEKYDFDIIFSNPPYIKSNIITSLDRDIFEYEPLRALDGGEDGLEFYRKITLSAKKYLKQKGLLVYEIGHDQAYAVDKIMQATGFYNIEIMQDLAGHDRVISGILY